jgi:hypothetical protein
MVLLVLHKKKRMQAVFEGKARKQRLSQASEAIDG